jgi:hypothetical protein
MIGIGWLEGLFIDERTKKAVSVQSTIHVSSFPIGREVENGMGLRTGTKCIRAQIAAAVVAALSVAFSVGCDSRDTVLVIEKPTAVHGIIQASSQDPSTNVQIGNVIATLQAGETARAVGVYHGQDHDGFHVKLPDGTDGLILAGDTFKVTSR